MNIKKLSVLVILVLLPVVSSARPMITDLSDRKIEIHAKFTGKELLLFGARIEAGNIVIVVRGPDTNYVVRKKERVAGMWINTESIKIKDVPQFYRIASSKPLSKMDAQQLVKSLGIGFENVKFRIRTNSSDVNVKEFQEALIQKLSRDRLIKTETMKLPYIEGTLFKMRLDFPEKIAEGIYTAEIYSFNDGTLQAIQSIPIKVNKVGTEAFIYKSAHEYPALYGLFAIAAAIVMGGAAGRIFRKV